MSTITQDRDGWSRVPHWLLSAVKPQAVVVYAALAEYADLPDGARPRIRQVADRITVSEATVKRALRELASVGAVTVQHRQVEGQQIASRYHLHLVRRASPEGGGVTNDPTLGSQVNPGVGSQMTYQESDSVQSDSSTASAAAAPAVRREDVDSICSRLADRVEANTDRRPTITDGWRNAARLLIDRDQRSVEDIVRVIDWATTDPFWRANVLGMPKLREKFDQLWVKARAGQAVQAEDPAPRSLRDTNWSYPPEIVGDSRAEREYRASIGLGW